MNTYQKLKEQSTKDFHHLTKKYNLLSTLRLLAVIVLFFSGYQYFSTSDIVYLLLGFSAGISFILLLRLHEKAAKNRAIKKELIFINNEEINYLNGEEIPYKDGAEYIDYNHLYTYDLDVFGKNSLFHNLNRTATYIGRKKLAEALLSLGSDKEIKSNQLAIQELSQKITWRQNLFALSRLTKDNKTKYQNLIEWTKSGQKNVPKILFVVLYVVPLIFVVAAIALAMTKNPAFMHVSISAFLVNIVVLVTQLKKIKQQLIGSDKIHEIINQYSFILAHIEQQKFKSEKLNQLKKKLDNEAGLASKQIKQLSMLFSNLESVHNGLAALLLNGTFLYHIRGLINVLRWKRNYSKQAAVWLEVIGAFEALSSVANFSFNNPSFCFPTLNKNYAIDCKELGHPLIDSNKRICNDVDFTTEKFIILTGSNMSGKSTFLRTLGINMVLAGMGAPICASEATIHPLKVIVSMRQTDSLTDGASYFFAEVKRLKQIMDTLSAETCFVLLDEILRGTNSQDKQNGTIEVIKKILSKKAIGAIATHDLEVCEIASRYPNQLTNKCFEVEITNDTLSFDYKLKNGICKNKSATFLIKKMGVI